MDYVLALPEDLEMEYEREMQEFEKGQKVTFLSRFERKGLAQGREEGLAQGREQGLEQGLEQGQITATQAAVAKALETRFGKVPKRMSKRLKEIADLDILTALLGKAIVAPTLKDFDREMGP